VAVVAALVVSGQDEDSRATAATTSPSSSTSAEPTRDAAASASAVASRSRAAASSSAAAARESAAAAAFAAASAQLRGLGQNLAWWNATYPAVPITECSVAGEWEYWEQPGPDASAWRLPSGALVCADPALPAWSGRIVVLSVFFDFAVDEAAALSAATSVLPADTSHTGTLAGHNADYSLVFDGSCVHQVYRSASFGTVIHRLDDSWTAPELISVTLYSGTQTAEGASSPYDPDSVHQVSISLGPATAANPDGTANC
jgi:hypothetical protein